MKRLPTIGDKVEVIEPHPEKGAQGVVIQTFPPNKDYRSRARVQFHDPFGEGQSVIDQRMLKLLS